MGNAHLSGNEHSSVVGALGAFLRGIFPVRRVVTTVICCSAVALLFGVDWQTSLIGLWARVIGIGLILLLVFGTLERWPRRLPRGVARWALQVIGVIIRCRSAPCSSTS